jgi:hypothetical protein
MIKPSVQEIGTMLLNGSVLTFVVMQKSRTERHLIVKPLLPVNDNGTYRILDITEQLATITNLGTAPQGLLLLNSERAIIDVVTWIMDNYANYLIYIDTLEYDVIGAELCN